MTEKNQPTDQTSGEAGSLGRYTLGDFWGSIGERLARLWGRLHKKDHRLGWLFMVMMFFLLVLGGLALTSRTSERSSDSSTLDDSSDAGLGSQVVADPLAGASEEIVEPPSEEADGPLSGVWNMYWTNSEQSENVGLIFQFVGVDSGTVEVLNDETEHEFETSFTLDGDYLSVEFTRLIGAREVPEGSKWQGSFISKTELN